MLIQLLFANVWHFSITVFGAFIFFSCGWIYLDSTNIDKTTWIPKARVFGFFLLALVLMVHAIKIDISLVETVVYCAEAIGLYLMLISLIFDPVVKKPNNLKNIIALSLPATVMIFLSTVLYLLITIFLWLKSTIELNKQLRLAFVGFIFLTLSESIRMANYWSGTNSVYWSEILSEYGPVWFFQNSLELIGMIILGIWLWGYIRFRHQIQLFITSIASTLSVFLITTSFFCFLLMQNLENNALASLSTDAKVLQYLLEKRGEETLDKAKLLVNSEKFKEAFLKNDQNKLYNLSTEFMVSQNINSIIAVNLNGKVIMRTDNKEKFGDSIINDQGIKNAIDGKQSTAITMRESLNFPIIEINTSVPIYQQNKVIGAVAVKLPIDNAFVDGVKEITGLDVTIFGNEKRVATTLLGIDGVSRSIGTKETNKEVLNMVLKRGKPFIGPSQVLNQPYYSAYLPLKTYDNKVIGMLYVGKIQTALIETTQKSIQLTFLGSAILILLSIIPTYFLSKYIKFQMEA